MRHGTVAASAGILFFYLFLRPELDVLSGVILFGIWGAAMMWDLQVTFANRSYILKHERSIVLLFAYKRLPVKYAAILTMLIEAVCVSLLPAVISFEVSAGQSAAVAYLFTMLHLTGASSNERFIKSQTNTIT